MNIALDNDNENENEAPEVENGALEQEPDETSQGIPNATPEVIGTPEDVEDDEYIGIVPINEPLAIEPRAGGQDGSSALVWGLIAVAVAAIIVVCVFLAKARKK